ncbi:hypothetical protein W97_01325 [Coniosporium apollinis CBS 100218]|uniref:Uncharacterized protein n=1 Tax=Coniosporium apollinis (strain CBS 100218) TaxID=1168221 RepID=R7YKH9_CONA1|nr:uncharacterized protein W97_01325 [Coniosporium apollinis CBS 100218]EON62106.1 hypothetical protein W97_01325 [Coniosporium apollinis CBS 100218]
MSTGGIRVAYFVLRDQLPQIKRLYFQRQYKLCAARCIEMLQSAPTDIEPVHATYLSFYAALSYDALARDMHHSSSARLRTLQLAEEHYTAAISKLGGAALTAKDPYARAFGELHSTNESTIIPDACRHRSSFDSGYSTAASRPTTAQATSLSHEPSGSDVLDDPFITYEPSPLRVHKAPPRPTPEALRFNNRLAERDLSAELAALLTSPVRPRDPASNYLSSPGNDDEDTFILSTSRHIRRYKTHLASLTSMLQAHLDSVRSRIVSAQPLRVPTHKSRPRQERRRHMSDEEKAERIRRGREVRWARERFCAEKYEVLCRRALAEL